MSLVSDFKPALVFLGKFLGIYILGNVMYGLFIASWHPAPDPATRVVTQQSSWCLNGIGEFTTVRDHAEKASIGIVRNDDVVISVFEGCNGLNVMIIFVAFVVAFGGPRKAMLWFIPLGLVIIHLVNLLRVGLLYATALHFESYFYYVHKYFFTAILYVIVFMLWAIWVLRINKVSLRTNAKSQGLSNN
jgi:exosortase family protein XrtF